MAVMMPVMLRRGLCRGGRETEKDESQKHESERNKSYRH